MVTPHPDLVSLRRQLTTTHAAHDALRREHDELTHVWYDSCAWLVRLAEEFLPGFETELCRRLQDAIPFELAPRERTRTRLGIEGTDGPSRVPNDLPTILRTYLQAADAAQTSSGEWWSFRDRLVLIESLGPIGLLLGNWLDGLTDYDLRRYTGNPRSRRGELVLGMMRCCDAPTGDQLEELARLCEIRAVRRLLVAAVCPTDIPSLAAHAQRLLDDVNASSAAEDGDEIGLVLGHLERDASATAWILARGQDQPTPVANP